ncbi:MAG: 4-hydroxy-tetrahydrodipicolinate reductase [Planctomycetota bacterium]|nr:MAG: 4-hydroxy-tetrahydrodipicolinate reductase [Planctomycetota bacterium]
MERMITFALNGAMGRMGKRIAALSMEDNELELIQPLEHEGHPCLGKSYGSFIGHPEMESKISSSLEKKVDGIIDFSSPKGLRAILEKAKASKIPLVSGTTGLEKEDMLALQEASQNIPILYSTNMSLGINLLRRLVREVARALGNDFDIELVEAHHNQKADAPSGTCMTLFEDICQVLKRDPQQVARYGREGKPGKRTKEEIGLHALRMGSVVGDHRVYFASQEEILELSHRAQSRDVFAKGALKGLKWIIHQKPGLYSMEDMLFG